MKRLTAVSIAIAVLILTYLSFSPASLIYLKLFSFNEKNALEKWSEMPINGRVKYFLTKSGDNGFVEALSDKTCSALYYRIWFKPSDYPILTWKWRVLKFPDKSGARTEKERDDYAARVYVIFPFLSFSSSKFIEYVWSDDLPAGTMKKSPLADNVRQIVVRSSTLRQDEWASESRNIYDDYLMAFGKPPALSAGAVAIMCDADNTKTSAESLFDDIAIGTETGIKRRLV